MVRSPCGWWPGVLFELNKYRLSLRTDTTENITFSQFRWRKVISIITIKLEWDTDCDFQTDSDSKCFEWNDVKVFTLPHFCTAGAIV